MKQVKLICDDTLEQEIVLSDIYQKLEEGERQIADGEERDGDEVLSRLREKYFSK